MKVLFCFFAGLVCVTNRLRSENFSKIFSVKGLFIVVDGIILKYYGLSQDVVD